MRVTGEEQLLSKLVNLAIRSPLYPLMKVMAKRTMKQTAEGRGVPWGRNIEDLTARLQVGFRHRLVSVVNIMNQPPAARMACAG